MNFSKIPSKLIRGFPYAVKEMRARVSESTPLFIAKPRVVHLWRNAPCNGRCVMCYFGFRKGEELHSSFKHTISDEAIGHLLEQIHELAGSGTMVSYMGGEPLLTRPLLDWLDKAKQRKLDFRFTSNGYCITEEIARRFVAADLFNIGISLESLDKTINEQIRPFENGTEKTINAIELLLAEKARRHARLSINIKCTLTALNLDSIIDIVERWGRRDGILITPQVFEPLDGMPQETKDKLWISDVPRIETTTKRLKELRDAGYNVNADDQALENFVRVYRDDPAKTSTMSNKTVTNNNGHGCSIGTDNLFIIHGEIKLCPLFPSIGKVSEKGPSLKEVWTSDAAQKCRQQIKHCNKVCTQSCLRRPSLLHKVKTFLKM